jgi:apolipoprotein N-acyltransferase
MPMRLIAFIARHPLWIALIAGVVSATGFAPLGFWPLTLLSFALLMMQVAQAHSGRRAFLLGWLFGMGHFTLGDHWIATAFTYQAAMPAWLGWLAVPLLSLLLAVYPALAAWGAWWFRRRLTPNIAITLPFAMLWIITEWLRSWVFTGFAWNPLGAIWLADFDSWTPLVARSLSWIGTYGLSGLTVVMAGVLGSVVMPIAMYLMMRG